MFKNNNMGKLYLIPTPVGNMEDITLRALRLLKEADLFWQEDTRTSAKLLKHYGITTPLLPITNSMNINRWSVLQNVLSGERRLL